MRLNVDVVVWRGDIAESRHRVQLAVVDSAGARAAESDDAELVTTFRSAAKPFQLLPLVERGHAERWGWSDEQLAVMASSHTGSAYHIALVRGILDRLGLGDADLACGYHDPVDEASRAHLDSHPEQRSALYNNCSGKHAGMLCLARSEGWPVEGYERPDHPLQRLMRDTVAELCGLAPADLAVAIDGCSVSVFGLPLSGMARAYARLAAATGDGDARTCALARIRTAMTAHPVAVGGAERFSTTLMQATRGRLVAKGGAEGLECVGVPDAGLGVAVKCEDGATRGVGPATLAVLDHLGALAGAAPGILDSRRRSVLRNAAGLDVGRVEAVIRAGTPAARRRLG